jgi:hypothetical protein
MKNECHKAPLAHDNAHLDVPVIQDPGRVHPLVDIRIDFFAPIKEKYFLLIPKTQPPQRIQKEALWSVGVFMVEKIRINVCHEGLLQDSFHVLALHLPKTFRLAIIFQIDSGTVQK